MFQTTNQFIYVAGVKLENLMELDFLDFPRGTWLLSNYVKMIFQYPVSEGSWI